MTKKSTTSKDFPAPTAVAISYVPAVISYADVRLNNKYMSDTDLGFLAGMSQDLCATLGNLLDLSGQDAEVLSAFYDDVGDVSIDWGNPRSVIQFAAALLDVASGYMRATDALWASAGHGNPRITLPCGHSPFKDS